jgi:thiamine biosynthesis lipoprotein ApbE
MSPEFQEVYTYMQEFYTETEGYFNPLVNVSSIGYDKSFEKIYKKQEKQQNIPQDINTDFSSIKTQGDTIELQIGQNLDFGGIVKGYSVDKVKNFLREK